MTGTNGPLTVGILEGDKATNSLPLLRSVPVIVEIRDRNDFPVEGAAVIFTLPPSGPGGTYNAGGFSYATRSDSHGQASAPAMLPRAAGKFEIRVSAALGERKGETVLTQTNSTQAFFGTEVAPRRLYRKKLVVGAVAGVAVLVAVILLTRKSSTPATTVTITPGAPVFH